MCFMFVFAALLEYAAVNYSYYGGRSRHRETVSEWPNHNQERCNVKDKDDTEGSINLRDFVPRSLMEVDCCTSLQTFQLRDIFGL